MLKTKVIISSVTNLTDARYFAAWVVDYLSFDIHPESESFVSPTSLAEIVSWIEGPEIILDVGPHPDHMILEDYRNTSPGFYLLSSSISISPDFVQIFSVDHPVKDEECFIIYSSDKHWENNLYDIKSLISQYPDRLFLDIPFAPEHLDQILELNAAGIVLRGGAEEKVGYKSFDDLDEIFDMLLE